MSVRRSTSMVLTTLLAATVLATAAPVAAATPPIGQFPLKGTLKNTAGTSLKLTKLGDVTFESVTGPQGGTRQAVRIDDGEGLELTTFGRAARSTYTIEVQFQFEEVVSYQRILSFGPNDRDAGLYVYQSGIRLYPTPFEAPIVAIEPGDWVTVRVARNGDTGRMQVYWSTANGFGVFTRKDAGGNFKLRGGIVDFFQDDGGEDAVGYATRITAWSAYKPVKVGID